MDNNVRDFLVSSSKKPLLRLRGEEQARSDAVVDDIQEILNSAKELKVELPPWSKLAKFLSDRHAVHVPEISVRRVVERLSRNKTTVKKTAVQKSSKSDERLMRATMDDRS